MKLSPKFKVILFVCWVLGFIILGYAVSITQLFGMQTLSLISLILLLLWFFPFALHILFNIYQLTITRLVTTASAIVFSILAVLSKLQTPNHQNPTFNRFAMYLFVVLMIASIITQSKELKLKAQMKTEQDNRLD